MLICYVSVSSSKNYKQLSYQILFEYTMSFANLIKIMPGLIKFKKAYIILYNTL